MGMNPITGEFTLDKDDIEFHQTSIPEAKYVYIEICWLYIGKRCGLAMKVDMNEFEKRNDWNVAYKIAKELSRSFANYHNDNLPMYVYITSATVDKLAEIIQNN